MKRALLLLLLAFRTFATDAPRGLAVDSIALTVSDLDRSVDFYTRVLDFEKVSEAEVEGPAYEQMTGVFGVHLRVARLRLGDEYLELDEFLAPRGRPAPVGARSNDRWFQHVALIVSDMDAAYRRLRQYKVQHASPSPQRLPDWNPNAGGIRAFYFRDPDGHPLEVLQFPAGKGAEKWHRAYPGRLFLGIDHTAIVISDTEASMKFYRDTLGMQVAGHSENSGPEQARLNNVAGAHLRITAMRAAAGPGVEFLEYLAPRDGRPFPPEEQANDLVHWQTRFRGPLPANTAAAELPDAQLGFRKSVVFRDPDGHAVQIVEP